MSQPIKIVAHDPFHGWSVKRILCQCRCEKEDEFAFVQRKPTKIKSQNGFPVLTSILDNVQDRRDEFSRCLGSLATNINDSSLHLNCTSSIIPAVSKIQQQNIMDCELRLKDSDVLITDSVLDFSKYLTSSDLPASPEEFFDDLFVDDQLQKPLPCPVKVKQEPCYSSASSRCSTPESLLPEHDFENIDIPSPKFYANDCRQDSLVYQLQAASQHHNKNVPKKNSLHHKLQHAFTEFQDLSEASVGSPVINVPKKVKSTQKAGKRKSCDKASEEYRLKRERNNIAVRKSRSKSKMKHIETEVRVSELAEENEQLRSKVVLLQRELAALRNFVALNAPAVVTKAPGFFSSAVPNNIDNPSIYLNCTDKSKITNGRVDRVC